MSIVTHISRFNCLGSSALFAAVALTAIAFAESGVPAGDDAAEQNKVRNVSESCPDIPSVRFDLPARTASFMVAVRSRAVFEGGAR